MGYYTQHIIQIFPKKKATVENYKRIAAAIQNINGYGHLLIHDGIMDDSNWNNGAGCKWYRTEDANKISAAVPDLKSCFSAVGESHAWDDFGASNEEVYIEGDCIESYTLDTDEFYEKYGIVKKECCSSDDEEILRPAWMSEPSAHLPRYDER